MKRTLPFQQHVENLRAWSQDRETELERQYQEFLKESRTKELESVAKKMAEKEKELFFFDNYDQMEKEKAEKYTAWRRTWPRRTWARQINMGGLDNHNKYKTNWSCCFFANVAVSFILVKMKCWKCWFSSIDLDKF